MKVIRNTVHKTSVKNLNRDREREREREWSVNTTKLIASHIRGQQRQKRREEKRTRPVTVIKHHWFVDNYIWSIQK